jgi:hypothetical protein
VASTISESDSITSPYGSSTASLSGSASTYIGVDVMLAPAASHGPTHILGLLHILPLSLIICLPPCMSKLAPSEPARSFDFDLVSYLFKIYLVPIPNMKNRVKLLPGYALCHVTSLSTNQVFSSVNCRTHTADDMYNLIELPYQEQCFNYNFRTPDSKRISVGFPKQGRNTPTTKITCWAP